MMRITDIINPKICHNKYYLSNRYMEYDDISQYPIINKNTVLKHYHEIFTPCSNMITVQTSGSTGEAMKIPWNSMEYYSSLATLWRLRKRHNIAPTDTYLTCHSSIDIRGQYLDSKVVISANEISLSKNNFSEEDIENYIKYIRMISPRWIYAQPSFVYFLGHYIASKQKDILRSFEYIELVGELLTPEVKESIRQLYENAEVVNMYGMQEFNGIMYENNGWMEAISDNVYVEILRDDGSACDIGEEGDIVVSGLKNSVLPLIRYNTGDRGKKIEKDNSSAYIITSGRSNDYMLYNGKYYDGSFIFVVVNEYNKTHVNKITRFQVVYDNNILNCYIKCTGKIETVWIGDEIKAILKRLYQIDISVRIISDVNYQYIFGENKTKYFINNNQKDECLFY